MALIEIYFFLQNDMLASDSMEKYKNGKHNMIINLDRKLQSAANWIVFVVYDAWIALHARTTYGSASSMRIDYDQALSIWPAPINWLTNLLRFGA